MFLKSYWEYYLELEEQFLSTKRFIAFDKANQGAFSIEYLKLYQAVCSEIDVVGKEIAAFANPNFKIDEHTNIKKWGYEVQRKYPFLKDSCVIFNDSESIQPFKDWEYEVSISKKGCRNLKIKDDKKPIRWWKNYNVVKHRRIGLVEGTDNFHLANQKNLIDAFSALCLLEMFYIKELQQDRDIEYQKSALFKIAN